MKNNIRIFIGRTGLVTGIMIIAAMSWGAVIQVPQDRSSIQGAIDSAQDGDEIVVSPGFYYENIHF